MPAPEKPEKKKPEKLQKKKPDPAEEVDTSNEDPWFGRDPSMGPRYDNESEEF